MLALKFAIRLASVISVSGMLPPVDLLNSVPMEVISGRPLYL